MKIATLFAHVREGPPMHGDGRHPDGVSRPMDWKTVEERILLDDQNKEGLLLHGRKAYKSSRPQVDRKA